MPQTINVCLIGQKFMGRTHSNAFLKVGKFFDVPVLPVMYTICGRNEAELREFQDRWGWQRSTTEWKRAVRDSEVGLVDVGTPNNLHAEMSIAALEAGKHVACEKPLAGTLSDARMMRDASKPRNDPRIQLPDERSGLVFVFRVFDRISYALIMQITRPVRPLDVVQTP